MPKSTRNLATALAILVSVLCLANPAFAAPKKPPMNKKMDQNNDHKIDQKEKMQGKKVWNQNNNQGPNNKFNANKANNCQPGDQKCIQKSKMQGQQQNCHPKDTKCIERYKKFKKSQNNKPWASDANNNTGGNAGPNQQLKKKSQVNKPWEEHADTNNDGHVGKIEAKKAKKDLNYKKDIQDGTFDGPPSNGAPTEETPSSDGTSTSTP